MPCSCLMHLRDLEMPSPVIGDMGGLFPRIEVSVCIDTDMTNDPIEELRLSISMFPF